MGRPSPSNTGVTLLAFLVMVLLAAGAIVLQARSLVELPANPTSEDVQNWYRTMRQMSFIGAVLLDTGVGMLLLMSVLVAVRRSDVAEGVRRGVLILATVVTALWLLVAFAPPAPPIP